ncbi:hypothetical protein LIER_37788 [Lithospermum erythrorhizon]|uniref:GAG-pre-integrase domain-containing protein n=1 Tax=Lithospermum erythrorhizon TaxID=34254 RepID=A0AAV3PSH9_LITER
MKGVRSSDNCYLWTPFASLGSRVHEDVDLWYMKLGHTIYQNIKQLISKEVVRGLPKFEIKEKVCRECKVEKLTKVVITRVLELMHMDLMGPIQVESYGSKRYETLREFNKMRQAIMESINVKVIDQDNSVKKDDPDEEGSATIHDTVSINSQDVESGTTPVANTMTKPVARV